MCSRRQNSIQPQIHLTCVSWLTTLDQKSTRLKHANVSAMKRLIRWIGSRESIEKKKKKIESFSPRVGGGSLQDNNKGEKICFIESKMVAKKKEKEEEREQQENSRNTFNEEILDKLIR